MQRSHLVASFAYAIIAKIMRRQSANPCLRIFNLSDSPDNQDPVFTIPNLEHYRHRKSPLSAPRLRKNKAMCFVFLSKESRQCAVLISAVYTSKFAGI